MNVQIINLELVFKLRFQNFSFFNIAERSRKVEGGKAKKERKQYQTQHISQKWRQERVDQFEEKSEEP